MQQKSPTTTCILWHPARLFDTHAKRDNPPPGILGSKHLPHRNLAIFRALPLSRVRPQAQTRTFFVRLALGGDTQTHTQPSGRALPAAQPGAGPPVPGPAPGRGSSPDTRRSGHRNRAGRHNSAINFGNTAGAAACCPPAPAEGGRSPGGHAGPAAASTAPPPPRGWALRVPHRAPLPSPAGPRPPHKFPGSPLTAVEPEEEAM